METKITRKTYGDEVYDIFEVMDGDTEVSVAQVMIVADDGSAFEKPLVERIDVIEGYRGQGVGTALLRHIATTYGTIDIVPDNEGAARLYARLGAELSFTDYNAYGFAFDQNFGVYEIRG